MRSLIKIFGIALFILAGFLVCGVALASSASDLQPAATVTYSEPVQINSSLRAEEPSYFPKGVHIGQQGTGGVTFFNGTIVNATTGTGNAGIPVTFGDDVRIDGALWRGTTQGPGDDMPVKVMDDMYVDGVLTGGGSVVVDDDLEVSGTANIEGETIVDDNLKVTGTAEIDGKVTLKNDLEVDGNAKVKTLVAEETIQFPVRSSAPTTKECNEESEIGKWVFYQIDANNTGFKICMKQSGTIQWLGP